MRHTQAKLTWLAATLAIVPALALAQEKGTISGKVDATPAKYLEETVVYLKSVPGTYTPKTHTMDQKGMKFVPHMLTVTAGDSVKFTNSDSVQHNVYSTEAGFNLGTFGPNESKAQAFTKEGLDTILCGLHPDMLAYVFVGQNPYSAVVGKDGTFTIKDVPPGSYDVEIVNPKLKAPAKKVTVAAGGKATADFSAKR